MAVPRAAADEDLDESPEAVTKEVFKPYQCRSSRILEAGAQSHNGDIAEPSSLAAIPLPPSSYPLFDAYPLAVVQQGRLSQLQLEGVLYACSRHQQILPSGERAGFFIGDGAGVGKGRQIAGVLLDNYARGRRRHLWLSTSTDLHVDATRDVRDLGAHIPVINGCASLDAATRALGLDRSLREGVLFLTYSTLISGGRGGRSRLTQVLEWLVGGTNSSSSRGDESAAALAAAARAWEGVLVFDECHKAKNFAPGKEAQSTKVASAVIELQAMLPNARVLYCSATGVSEVGNMAYMARMGLWGPTSAFPDFATFLESMKKRGVSFMELLAMEMKAAGRYVARGLSFRDAEFLQVEAPLRPSKVQQYDAAVVLWRELRLKLEQAQAQAGSEAAGVWKTYWSAHQRFFKLLCIDLKMETVLAESKAALASGMCVVIGLQSTGEAAADAMGLEPGPLPGFVSPCKELLMRFIQQHFPVLKAQSAEAAAAGLPQEAIPACRQMRQQLLSKVSALQLPANFLDVLVDELGGPGAVAEMTGRKGRVVRVAAGGAGAAGAGAAGAAGGGSGRQRVEYQLRAKPDSSEMDSLNVSERDQFMSGNKRVALISDAASTGISLHAVATADNTARRLHLTVELPWSADKAIQQFGRSHRTNQVSAPIYKLVVSAAGGERRFAAAVARRLQSLGALTRGDRRAAAGVDLSDSNFDSPWGRKSLRRMYDHIVCESTQLPAGVTVSALMKDLLPTAAAAAATGSGGGSGSTQKQQQQQQLSETLRLLQAEIPALPVLLKLAARESAAAAAAGRQQGAAGTPSKQQQQQNGSQRTPQQQQQQNGSQRTPGRSTPASTQEDEESRILAALTGSTPGSGGRQQQQQQQMSAAEVGMAISELHAQLRSCCDMMEIGLGSGGPRKEDTVAEDQAKDAGVGTSKAAKDAGDVRRFLNRLLGLPLGRQNLLFNYFAATLAAEIGTAKAEGRYSEGVSDLQGSAIWLDKPPQLLWRADGTPGTPTAAAAAVAGDTGQQQQQPVLGDALGTWVHTLVVDRGVSYQDAQRRLAHESFPGCSSGFFRSRRPMFGAHVVLLALQKPGLRNLFTVLRPNTGESVFDMERSDLDAKYSPVKTEDAQADWEAIYQQSLSSCMHGPTCTNRGHCTVGSRLSEVTILSGAVVRVWGVLESVLDRHAHELHKSERAMRVVRVAFSATKPANATAAAAGKSGAEAEVAAAGDGGEEAAAAQQVSQDVELPEGSQQVQQQQQEQQQDSSPKQQAASKQKTDLQQQQQGDVSSTPAGTNISPAAGSSQQGSPAATAAAAAAAGSKGSPEAAAGSNGRSPSNSRSPSKSSAAAGAGAAAAAAAGPGATLSLVGVRYPAHLLPEVVATLASLQEQAQTNAAIAAVVAANRSLQGLASTQLPQQGLLLAGTQGLAMSSWGKSSLAKTAAQQQQQQPLAAAAAAAAAGAVNDALGIARVEPPTPVDPKLKEKAYRAPKTLLSFYSKAATEPGAGFSGQTAAAAADSAPAAAAAAAVSNGAGPEAGAARATVKSSMSNAGGSTVSSAAAAAAAAAAAGSGQGRLSPGASRQGAGKQQGSGSKGSAGSGQKSNPLLRCFSRMAATQAAAAAAATKGGQKRQQQQGAPPAKKLKAGVTQQQQQKQRAGSKLGFHPAKRQKQQQQQQKGGADAREQSVSASVICIDSSDSELDAGVAAAAAAAVGSSGRAVATAAAAAGGVSSTRPKRPAVATAGAHIAAAAAAGGGGGGGGGRGSDGGQGAQPGKGGVSPIASSSISSGVQDWGSEQADKDNSEGGGDDDREWSDAAEGLRSGSEDSGGVIQKEGGRQTGGGGSSGPQEQQQHKAEVSRPHGNNSRQQSRRLGLSQQEMLHGQTQQQQQQRPGQQQMQQQRRGGQQPKQQQQQQHVTAAALEVLAGMGFTGMQAERALWVAQGDVQGAVEFCLRG